MCQKRPPFLLSVEVIHEASADICKIYFDRKIDTVMWLVMPPLPRLCPLSRSPIVRSYDKLHTQTHYLELLKHLMDN